MILNDLLVPKRFYFLDFAQLYISSLPVETDTLKLADRFIVASSSPQLQATPKGAWLGQGYVTHFKFGGSNHTSETAEPSR